MRRLIKIVVEQEFTEINANNNDSSVYFSFLPTIDAGVTCPNGTTTTPTPIELYIPVINFDGVSINNIASKLAETISDTILELDIIGYSIDPYLDINVINNTVYVYIESDCFHLVNVNDLNKNGTDYQALKNEVISVFNGTDSVNITELSIKDVVVANSEAGVIDVDCGNVIIEGKVKGNITSVTSDNANIINYNISGDFIYIKVERIGKNCDFIIKDIAEQTIQFTEYIPDKISEDDFDFNVIKIGAEYVLIVKYNLNKDYLFLKYGIGSVVEAVTNTNFKVFNTLEDNVAITIIDCFNCSLIFNIDLKDYYFEKEDYIYISSENSIRYVEIRDKNDACCFDNEENTFMNEFSFNNVNICRSQLFTNCDNVTTQVKSSKPVNYKTLISGDAYDDISYNIADIIEDNIDKDIICKFKIVPILDNYSIDTKEYGIIIKSYIDGSGDEIIDNNGVPSILIDKKLTIDLILLDDSVLTVSFFINGIKYDNNINSFYIPFNLYETQELNEVQNDTLTVKGDLKEYNLYEFDTNMSGVTDIFININNNLIKSDDIQIIDVRVKNLLKIKYWSYEDTTLVNTSIIGVKNFIKEVTNTNININKETVITDNNISNINIKSNHDISFNIGAVKVQLLRDLIDAISNKYVNINGIDMTYKSHTSKVIDNSGIAECVLTFYRDVRRGVNISKHNKCSTSLIHNKDQDNKFINTNNNFKINISNG